MQIKKINFKEVDQFSKRDKAYIGESPKLKKFYKYSVNLKSFEQVIADKRSDKTNRKLLHSVLVNQYDKIGHYPLVDEKINLLKNENCFTVTTAHQPSLFCGPLYYVYKIFSTINLSRQLEKAYPAYRFVPVFISGAEDHDFDEINYVRLFSRKLEWQNDARGPVGKMKTETLLPVLNELKNILGESENAKTIFHIINNAYTTQQFYGASTLKLVHELFKVYGLVVLDMNQKVLKESFIPVITSELFNRNSYKIVSRQITELNEAGYKTQASPREINLFYLTENGRNRIEKSGDKFSIVGSDQVFTRQEIEDELELYPERFSPNVILRPLYQEYILPNLAYIGGGGELAYWLERKTQFEFYNINFPMLIRRNSVLWIDQNADSLIKKLGLSVRELFEDTDRLIKNYLIRHSENSISLTSSKSQLKSIFENIEQKAILLDKTLAQRVQAEYAKQVKWIDQLESRMLKAEKQKQETVVRQIRKLKSKLFPENGLQERYDNFLPLYIQNGPAFFEKLIEALDPLEKMMLVIMPER